MNVSEAKYATTIRGANRNPSYGFKCIHYTVMENAKVLNVAIENKTR